MATKYPPEFRRRAVELARLHEKPIARIAEDLGISDATLHGWLKQADIDEGRRDGLTSDEHAEECGVNFQYPVPSIATVVQVSSSYTPGWTNLTTRCPGCDTVLRVSYK